MIIGVPAAGRGATGLDHVIGMFVNAMPLRLSPGKLLDGQSLIEQANAALKDGLLNQDVPFESIVRRLRAHRGDGMPLFQTMFSYLDGHDLRLDLHELVCESVPLDAGTSRFDLAIQVAATEGGDYDALFEYDTDLFDRRTIERWAGHLAVLLSELLRDPARSPRDLPWSTQAQAHELLVDWNARAKHANAVQDVVILFEQSVRARPDALAVQCGEAGLTYRELDARANAVAGQLVALGVGPDTVVGLHLDRSCALLVALWAVLKAGGAFLPLDKTLPPERISRMLALSSARVVLTDADPTIPASVASLRIAQWDFPMMSEFHVGGWSFGGLIALEVTRYLAKRGLRAGSVFAIDSALGEGTRAATTSDAPSSIEALLRRNLAESGHGGEIDLLFSRDGNAAQRVSLCLQSHVKVFARYRPQPCHADFKLILAQEGTARNQPSLRAWREAMGSRMTMSTVPGTHWSVLRQPGVRLLAMRIANIMTMTAAAESHETIETE